MAFLPFFGAFCLTAICYFGQGNAEIMEWHGMDMVVNAYEGVCWYEFLKHIPTADNDHYSKCRGKASETRYNVLSNMNPTAENVRTYFPLWLKKDSIGGPGEERIPVEYVDKCGHYLDEPDAEAPAGVDESHALNDGGINYPWRALAFCLMHTIRERNGDQAIEDFVYEKFSGKPFVYILQDRGNEFRALHGVKPLYLNDDLVKAAQSYAEYQAQNCDRGHSPADSRQYRGGTCGENIFAQDVNDTFEMAYSVSNGWYEEIKNYVYQDADQIGHSGSGHFTQMVWKDTTDVGYGFAYNPDCWGKGPLGYWVARYYPTGNVVGGYEQNVLPLLKS